MVQVFGRIKIQTSADCFLGPVSCHVQISSDIVSISRNRASVLEMWICFFLLGESFEASFVVHVKLTNDFSQGFILYMYHRWLMNVPHPHVHHRKVRVWWVPVLKGKAWQQWQYRNVREERCVCVHTHSNYCCIQGLLMFALLYVLKWSSIDFKIIPKKGLYMAWCFCFQPFWVWYVFGWLSAKNCPKHCPKS